MRIGGVFLSSLGVVGIFGVAHADEPAAPPASPPVEEAVPPADAPVAPPPPEAPVVAPAPEVVADTAVAEEQTFDEPFQVHGWLSQGFLWSTANNYLAYTSHGSFEFFEGGINASKQLTPNLRGGVQLFAQDLGTVGDFEVEIDWASLDWRYRPWLGVRAGRVKLPVFLYSEYLDADMTRTSVLLPQGVYNARFRNILSAINGADIYGTVEVGGGTLDYDVFGGTLALKLPGSTGISDSAFIENITLGNRLIYAPTPWLRLTTHALWQRGYAYLDLNDELDSAIRGAGLAPADWNGIAVIHSPHWTMLGGGLELNLEPVLISAEYTTWHSDDEYIDFPEFNDVRPPQGRHSDGGYVQIEYQATDRLRAGAYFSIWFEDYRKTSDPDVPDHWLYYQADTALSLRYDITPWWIVKLEGHYMDGTGQVAKSLNPEYHEDRDDPYQPIRRWGLVAAKTTLSF